MKTFWVAYLICVGCSSFSSCGASNREKVPVLYNSKEQCAADAVDDAAWRQMIFEERWEFECLPLSVRAREP